MIKYLQRLKGKKGFTIVELVVVVAIIAVLITSMSAALRGGNTENILSAQARAEAIIPACQLACTRAAYQLYPQRSDGAGRFHRGYDSAGKIPCD